MNKIKLHGWSEDLDKWEDKGIEAKIEILAEKINEIVEVLRKGKEK